MVRTSVRDVKERGLAMEEVRDGFECAWIIFINNYFASIFFKQSLADGLHVKVECVPRRDFATVSTTEADW